MMLILMHNKNAKELNVQLHIFQMKLLWTATELLKCLDHMEISISSNKQPFKTGHAPLTPFISLTMMLKRLQNAH
jgi:hypothetical protein